MASVRGHLVFHSSEHGEIVFHPVEKGDGVVFKEAAGTFGTMSLKEVQDDGWSCRFYSFHIAEDMVLTSRMAAPYLGILINGGTEVAYWQDGIKPGTLKEHQASLISVPYLSMCQKLFKGSVYSFCDICFSPQHLKPWEKVFRSLNRIRSKAEKRIPSFEVFDIADEGREIIPTVTRIGTTVENTGVSQTNRADRMNELLFNLFDLYESRAQSIKLHSTDIDLLNQVHDLLIHDPTASVNLKQLACKAGMNEFKLKNGFKKLFGSPVYQFFVAERMKRAKKLLADTNRSVGEVAVMVGYKSVSSFSAAYKKWFGYPPTSAR